MNKQIAIPAISTPTRDILANLRACQTHMSYRSRDGSAMALADLKRIGVSFPLIETLYNTQCAATKDKTLKKQLTLLFETVDTILKNIASNAGTSAERITLQLCLESWEHMGEASPQALIDNVCNRLHISETEIPRSPEALRNFLTL